MAESWLEVIAKRRGVTPDVLREQIKKNTVGCVIKALESVTGVQANEQEWRRRLLQVDVSEKDNRRLFDSIALFEDDTRQIEALVREIALSESPMGQALKGRQISSRRCDLNEIGKLIEQGNDIVSLGLIKSGNTIQAHASHLGYKEGVGLISISDDGQPIGLKPGVSLRVIVFSKKLS